MLIYFKVGNFRSIKEPVTLQFSAAPVSEHPDSNVVNNGGMSLLKSVLLYGHNASGKSNVLSAIVFFKWLITNSATEKQGNEPIAVEPFELSKVTEHAPSFFEASFQLDAIRYRYGFELDKEKIQKEWLLESTATKEYPVFLRIGDEFQLTEKRFKNAKGLDKRTRKNALFLSVASQWNVAKAEQINNWFDSIYAVHGLMDNNYKWLTINLLENKRYTQLINAFIQKADLGINTLGVTDIPVTVDKMVKNMPDEMRNYFKDRLKDSEEKAVFAYHNKYDENDNIVESVPFLMDEKESEGTMRFFNLIGVFITAIQQNRLVIIDEFDARFHTLLSKSILKLFNSAVIKSKAQLLIASHDTALLDRNILRRDQVYFVEKSIYGATQITSLAEYKPRKETPYDKTYLEGKYGAIPLIDDLESLIANG